MPIERLELEGFRSHANSTLDLVGVRSATFVGLVGSGKSSFQEAFRWLLFSESDCSDRGYVKLGASRCRVMAIVRTLAGTRYRAERIQTVNSTSLKTDLQLAVANGDGGWTPIGGKRIAETEARIRAEVVGMDYDTLISSAISPQGRSSMFTKPPKMFIDGKYYEGRQARIQIFAQSEGLGVWEEWRKTATKGANDADRQATTLEAQVVASDGELARRPSLYATLTAALDVQTESRRTQESLAKLIEQTTQDLATHRGTLDPLRRELAGFADTRQTLWTKSRALGEKTARVDTLTALLGRRVEIEQAAAKVAELDTLLATQQQDLAALEAEGKGVRAQVTTAEGARDAACLSHTMANTRLGKAQIAVANRPALEAKVARLGAARTEREDVSALKAQNEKVISARNADLSRIMAANLAAQKRAGEIEAEVAKKRAEEKGLSDGLRSCLERVSLIDEVSCRENTEYVATCPLLKNAREAKQGAESFSGAIGVLMAWVRPPSPPQQETAALRSEIATIEAAIGADRTTLAALEAEIATLQPAEAALASLDTIKATIPGLEADEATARTAQDAAVLAAANLRGSLDALTVRYLRLLEKIKESVSARELSAPTASLAPELAHADANLSSLQADVATLTAEIQTLQAALDREATVKATIAEAEVLIASATGTLALQRAELEQHKRTEAGALQQAATARAELAGLEKLATDRTQAAAEAARLREEHTILVALCLAYKQIPIMILETAAVPEVMDEASRILARISRSGMSTRLATFREVKSREELADGLDIFICDRLGERTYENYSVDGGDRVPLRRSGQIEYLPIKDLWDSERLVVKEKGIETQTADFETLCYQGGKALWMPVQFVLRHQAPTTLRKIVCNPGNYSVSVTDAHSVLIMTADGIKDKLGSAVVPGDWMLTPKVIDSTAREPEIDLLNYIGKEFMEKREMVGKPLRWDGQYIESRKDQSLPRKVALSESFGELIGIAVAEASGTTTLSFAVGGDKALAERVCTLLREVFGLKANNLGYSSAESMKRYIAKAALRNKGSYACHNPQEAYRPNAGGRLLAHIFGNMIGRGAENKHVPDFMFTAPRAVQLSFFRGLICGDGSLRVRRGGKQTEVHVTTVSDRLAHELIFLARQLGIMASMLNHGAGGYSRGVHHRPSYRVSFGSRKAVSLVFGNRWGDGGSDGKWDGIPLELLHRSSKSRLRMERTDINRKQKDGHRFVPKWNQEQYLKITRLLDGWNVLRVTRVEPVAPTDPYVYDLIVPETNNFIAGCGGILVHNSGGQKSQIDLAYRLALVKRQAQRTTGGLGVLWIDEGFETQDAGDLPPLIELLREMERDYAQTFITTHVEGMKETFPAQVRVEGGDGRDSSVELVMA